MPAFGLLCDPCSTEARCCHPVVPSGYDLSRKRLRTRCPHRDPLRDPSFLAVNPVEIGKCVPTHLGRQQGFTPEGLTIDGHEREQFAARRTIGPAEKETAVERGPAADHRRLARRPVLNDPIQLIGPASLVGNSRETFHKSRTDGSNPVPSANESVSAGFCARCRPKSRLWHRSGPASGREKVTRRLRPDAVSLFL